MKILCVVVLSCLLCGRIQSQQPAAAHMSFTFTTLALKALRLGSEYDGSPEHHVAGSTVSLSDMVDALQAAGDAARTSQELAAKEAVRKFLAAKVHNNDGRELEVARAWEAWQDAHPDANDHFIEQARPASRQLVLERPIFQKMVDAEEACRRPLDQMLRSGRYRKIAACDDVEVSVEEDLRNR
jgi:hypothetical protein